MDTQLTNTADEFVKHLLSIQEVKEYVSTLEKYDRDINLKSKIERYNILVDEIQIKQKTGNAFSDLMNELNSIANELKSDTLYNEIIEKQVILKTFLQKCNDEISSALGMDFARLATSAG